VPSPPRSPPEPDPGDTATSAIEKDPTDVAQQAALHSFGDYELLEEIARGGMGVVYKARQKSLGRLVAVKLILAGQFAGKQIAQRFKSEAIAAAVLQHPNIVAVHEVGVHNGQHFFSMDYVEGQNLADLVGQRPLRPREAARYVKLIAEAIHYAHGQGILHRDLKPSNVLIEAATDQPRVTDFGLARRLNEESSLTVTGQVLGSPHFMPPEQASGGRGKVGRTSDVFGLGGILYFLLTARAPFQGETLETTIEQVLRARPVSPRLLNPALPRDLETICLKCLEKAPERRYQSAQELADELGRFIRDEPILARPVSQIEKAWRWCRRKPVLAGLSATTLALLLSVAIGSPIALYQINQQRQRAEAANDETRRRAYAAEITAAFHALDENNLGRAIELLNRQRPKPGEEDLRGFEWRLLWQRCRSDEKVTFHEEGEAAACFSPDGRWFVYAHTNIIIREMPSLAKVATILHGTTTPHGSLTIAFSPRAKLMATGNGDGARLWSTETWQEIRPPLPRTRFPAVFSPDGKWLVTGEPASDQGGSGGFRVWNTETWEREGFCPGEITRAFVGAKAVVFSPDGKLLVTVGHPGGSESGHQFQVWDFPSLTVRTNFEAFPGRLASAAFTPAGKHLLTGTDTGALLVWNVAEGRIVERRNEHTGWLSTIAVAPDGRTFATASADRTVVLWDAATREELVRFRGHLDEVWSVAISVDGRLVASSARDGTTKQWDATRRHQQRALTNSLLVTGFSSDSRLLLVDGFGDSRLWNLTNGAVTTIPLEKYHTLHYRGWRGCLATTREARGPEPKAVYGRSDGLVELWNLSTMSCVTSWRAEETEVTTALLSPDGQFIATSGTNGILKLWSAQTQRQLRIFEALGGKLMSATFSPDGRLLAASEDKDMEHARVGIWDVNTGRLLSKLDVHGLDVFSVAFSPDSKLLATGQKDSNLKLWNVQSGKLRATLRGHIQPVVSAAFSPDGKTLAAGADSGRVKLWNVATEQELTTLEIPGGCRSLKFSPDGRTLAVGFLVEPIPCIWLWEVPSFAEIAEAEAKLNEPPLK